MKFTSNALSFMASLAAVAVSNQQTASAQRENNMVKLCFFYDSPSGHARSDPIINQVCPSDHVHTFYGPQKFHPDTTYEELRDADPAFSSSPVVENQSLYWHPTFYRVLGSGNTKVYERVDTLFTGPYYRWDTSTPEPTVAFPPGFRLIAFSDEERAGLGGENGSNLFTECCDLRGEEESCESRSGLWFPTQTCDFLGIGFAMPTCWDGTNLGNEESGQGSDHKSHVQYTLDGSVNGPCPDGFGTKVPQIQLFVRINNYQGGTYVLADGRERDSVFHFDFFNGWKEGSLQNIIDNCPVLEGPYEADEYNPPCGCDEFLTPSPRPSGEVCDVDVRELIVDEETRLIQGDLPRGTCEGPTLVPKSWGRNENPPLDCAVTPGSGSNPTNPPVASPTNAPVASPTNVPVPSPTRAPVASPTQQPVVPPTSRPTPGGDLSCDEQCEEGFTACDEGIDSICGDEVFLAACEQECEEEFGDEEEELEACIEEWCGEDQEICFVREERRCKRKRRRCFRGC